MAQKNIFSIQLNNVPAQIHKLIITASIDENCMTADTYNNIISFCHVDGSEKANYILSDNSISSSQSIIVAELIREENSWKLSILDDTFSGNLESLLSFFCDNPINEVVEDIVVDIVENEIPIIIEDISLPKPEKLKTTNSTKSFRQFEKPTEPMVMYTGFEEDIKGFVKRIQSILNNIRTEEATKTSIVMPLFQIMGFDVFNPLEFCPEYTADVGTKKGEKVDYSIMINGEPVILIEVKSINEPLEKHSSQLFRYFVVSKSRFAILTNGIQYKFYTDLDKENVMDITPFLEINLLDLKEKDFLELARFHKKNLDVKEILNSASELKYLGLISRALREDFSDPSDNFIRHILSQNVYSGIKTQNILEKFRPLVKKAIHEYSNSLVNDKIASALKTDISLDTDTSVLNTTLSDDSSIVTSEEDMQAYYIIRSILAEFIDPSRIFFKNTQSYFGIILDNKANKWICRIILREKKSYVLIPNQAQEPQRYALQSSQGLYSIKELLISRLNELI